MIVDGRLGCQSDSWETEDAIFYDRWHGQVAFASTLQNIMSSLFSQYTDSHPFFPFKLTLHLVERIHLRLFALDVTDFHSSHLYWIDQLI